MSSGYAPIDIPAGYGEINLYNSQFSPSTVHVKNVAIQRYFRKYLLQKAISVFKWTLPEEWDEMYATRSEEAITFPRTPPAAVTKRMGPTVFSVPSVKEKKSSPFPEWKSWIIAMTAPAARAIIGEPRNLSRSPQNPSHPAIEAMDPNAMRMMGSTSGASASAVPGKGPNDDLTS